jgi:arginine/lysine/ornithine decarboxylase
VWAEVLPQVAALGRLDLPELVGLEEAIVHAELLVAEAFGAERSFLLVNGATAGVQSALLAVAQEGEQVLVGRNCHRSAIAGLVLTGAQPIYLPTDHDPDWQIDVGVSPQTLEHYLQKYPTVKAVLLVSPNYFGVTGNLRELVAIAHRFGVPVIVDGAHGSHLGFHPDLPTSALALGADVVIHSLHKTGSALSQGAVLHCQGSLVPPERLAQALQLLQTTSPSFLLLLSLDIARWQLQTKGKQLIENTLHLVKQVAARSPLPVFQLANNFDPTRLTVSTCTIGLTGFRADELLTEWGVIAELPTLHHLVFSFSMGTSLEDAVSYTHLRAHET